MTVYCVIHHYGHELDPLYVENDYANETDLVEIFETKELAEKYIVFIGTKLGGYCGRFPDWLDKNRTQFGYEVNLGPDEREWDYYEIIEKNVIKPFDFEEKSS